MTEIESLKSENKELKKLLENNETELSNQLKRLEQYQDAYHNLQHQVKDLLRHRFGSRSERYIDPESPQIDLFQSEPQSPAPQEGEDTTIEVPAHKRKKQKKDTSKYPREIVIIPVSEEERLCPCGCEKQVIRYEAKEMFHSKPAEYCIIEQRREVVACVKGCQNSIITAPNPPHILPKVRATESLLANIIVSKFHHRQPLYHLKKYVDNIGVSRETMARWLIQLFEPLTPLYNLMQDAVIDYDISSIDATTLQVLKEPGRPPTKKSYVYCIRGGPPDKPVIFYTYNAKEHKIFVDDLLEGFQGSIHMDADPFFGKLLEDPNVQPIYCHAHARRKFEAIAKQAKKPGLAKEAMKFYKRLYKIERQAKDEKLDAKARYELRQKKSKPIMAEFKEWLDKNAPLVLPKSPLGKAFNYLLERWDEGFTAFLKDGRLEFDNNLTEQEIKPLVIARKNFIFANSVAGAKALCIHMTFIRTSLVNGLVPYKYLETIFKRIPYCKTVEDFEKLLPWNIDLDDPTFS